MLWIVVVYKNPNGYMVFYNMFKYAVLVYWNAVAIFENTDTFPVFSLM